MLESGVKEGMELLAMVDRQEKVRYVNDLAAKEMGLHSGWQDEASPPDAANHLLERAMDLVRRVFRANRPVSAGTFTAEGETNQNGRCYTQRPSWAGAGDAMGVVLQTRDLTPIAEMFETIKRLAACPDVDSLLRGLLEATRPTHEWGRLYRIDPRSDLLVGSAQYGLEEGSPGRDRLRARRRGHGGPRCPGRSLGLSGTGKPHGFRARRRAGRSRRSRLALRSGRCQHPQSYVPRSRGPDPWPGLDRLPPDSAAQRPVPRQTLPGLSAGLRPGAI